MRNIFWLGKSSCFGRLIGIKIHIIEGMLMILRHLDLVAWFTEGVLGRPSCGIRAPHEASGIAEVETSSILL